MVHQHTDGCEALSAVTHSLERVSEPWKSELSPNLNPRTPFCIFFDAESESELEIPIKIDFH